MQAIEARPKRRRARPPLSVVNFVVGTEENLARGSGFPVISDQGLASRMSVKLEALEPHLERLLGPPVAQWRGRKLYSLPEVEDLLEEARRLRDSAGTLDLAALKRSRHKYQKLPPGLAVTAIIQADGRSQRVLTIQEAAELLAITTTRVHQIVDRDGLRTFRVWPSLKVLLLSEVRGILERRSG